MALSEGLKWHDKYRVVSSGEILDGSKIRLFVDWKPEDVDKPRYAYMTGLKGTNGIVCYLDSELKPLATDDHAD